jgi:hypothetical protein
MIFLSRGNSPASKTIVRENMKIRWYQHSEQGGNSMTSLKNKLPRVEAPAINQHAKRIYQLKLSFLSE